MTNYRVCVTRAVTESQFILVEAETEDQAAEQALAQAIARGRWKLDEGSCGVEYPYISEVLEEDACEKCGTPFSQESIDHGRCYGTYPDGSPCLTMVCAMLPGREADNRT